MRDIRSYRNERQARRVLNAILPEYMRLPLDRMQKLYPSPLAGASEFAINTATGRWRCITGGRRTGGDLPLLHSRIHGCPYSQSESLCGAVRIKPIPQQVEEGIYELPDWSVWGAAVVEFGGARSQLFAELSGRGAGSHPVECPSCGEEAVVFTPGWNGHCGICGSLPALHLVALSVYPRQDSECATMQERIADDLDRRLRMARRDILEFHQRSGK